MRLLRIDEYMVINVDQIASIEYRGAGTRIYLSNSADADECYLLLEPLDKVLERIKTESFEI